MAQHGRSRHIKTGTAATTSTTSSTSTTSTSTSTSSSTAPTGSGRFERLRQVGTLGDIVRGVVLVVGHVLVVGRRDRRAGVGGAGGGGPAGHRPKKFFAQEKGKPFRPSGEKFRTPAGRAPDRGPGRAGDRPSAASQARQSSVQAGRTHGQRIVPTSGLQAVRPGKETIVPSFPPSRFAAGLTPGSQPYAGRRRPARSAEAQPAAGRAFPAKPASKKPESTLDAHPTSVRPRHVPARRRPLKLPPQKGLPGYRSMRLGPIAPAPVLQHPAAQASPVPAVLSTPKEDSRDPLPPAAASSAPAARAPAASLVPRARTNPGQPTAPSVATAQKALSQPAQERNPAGSPSPTSAAQANPLAAPVPSPGKTPLLTGLRPQGGSQAASPNPATKASPAAANAPLRTHPGNAPEERSAAKRNSKGFRPDFVRAMHNNEDAGKKAEWSCFVSTPAATGTGSFSKGA